MEQSHPIPSDMKIRCVSKALYEKAVKQYTGQDFKEEPGDGVEFLKRPRLECLNGGIDSPTNSTDPDQSIILDDRYDMLKSYASEGFRTIWFNPNGELAPELVPVQDMEIRNFDELTGSSSLFHLPALSQCYAWWDEWELPENVRQHALTVSHAAYTLAVWMRNKGINVNPILTHRAGMLHDLDKIKTLQSSG